MAKSNRSAKPNRKKETPPVPKPPEPETHSGDAAEVAFTRLPSRLDESLVVVSYTGRKRAYIHYGRAGNSTVFWYLIRSDGPRLLKMYPSDSAAECFSELLKMMEGWQANVNPDPMSDSYCDISPDVDVVEHTIRTRYLTNV